MRYIGSFSCRHSDPLCFVAQIQCPIRQFVVPLGIFFLQHFANPTSWLLKHSRRTSYPEKWQQYVQKKKKQDQICWFGTRHLYSPNNVQQHIKDRIQCTYSYSGDGYVEAWSCGEEMHWEFQLQHGRKSNPADVFMLERPV